MANTLHMPHCVIEEFKSPNAMLYRRLGRVMEMRKHTSSLVAEACERARASAITSALYRIVPCRLQQ